MTSSAEPLNVAQDDVEEEESLAFHQMGLDDRILKAVAKCGWLAPTAIQEKAIPLVLAGRDVLARGRTGSGKTGAFALPAIQKVLTSKLTSGGQASQCVRVLVMAPTRELCKQIFQVHFITIHYIVKRVKIEERKPEMYQEKSWGQKCLL